MNIQSLQSAANLYASPPITATGSSGPTIGTGPSISTGADALASPAAAHRHHGDGQVIAELKSALTAAGFSDSGANKPAFMAAMHNFTHAVFAATAAQKASDNSAAAGASGGNPIGTINYQGALQQVATAGADGNASSSLQAAFAALQQTQPAGSAASSASLTQVMATLAQEVSGSQPSQGALVDTSA